MIKTVCAAAAVIAALAAPAFAADVKETAEMAAPAEKVWAALGDFCGIGNWHPAVEKCALSNDGKVRTLTLAGGGGTIVETMTAWDDKAMSYSYTIDSGPLPVDKYTSTIKVIANGDKSTIEWSSNFEPKGATEDEAKGVMAGIYKAGFEKIAKGL